MLARVGGMRPSFQQGFARSAGESAYPELWNGLLGLWAPCLGPQGLTTLRDWSGLSRNGTWAGTALTGSDWIASPDGYGVEFDTARYVSVSTTASLLATLTRCSLMIWMNSVAAANFNAIGPVMWGERSGSTPIWKFQGQDGAATYRFVHRDDASSLTTVTGNAAINDAKWHLVGVVKNGTALTFYVDGKVDKTATLNGNDTLTVTDTRIGDEGFDSGNTQWSGALRGIMAYSRLLTLNEVMAMYQGASPLTMRPKRRLARVPSAAGLLRRLHSEGLYVGSQM